jgi:hypothetical protein
MTIWPGSTVRVEGRFLDRDTMRAIDPSNVVVHVLKRDGMPYLGAVIVRDAAGKYHADLEADQPGWWNYEWRSGEAADPGTFFVEVSAFSSHTL